MGGIGIAFVMLVVTNIRETSSDFTRLSVIIGGGCGNGFARVEAPDPRERVDGEGGGDGEGGALKERDPAPRSNDPLAPCPITSWGNDPVVTRRCWGLGGAAGDSDGGLKARSFVGRVGGDEERETEPL